MAVALATTTIAAPLWFYAEKNTDSITAAEFLKEAKARVAGNPVSYTHLTLPTTPYV